MNERDVKKITRAKAWDILCEHTTKESLIKHALAVETVMLGYAKKFGEDESVWGIVGLLHDFDYERWPDPKDHPFKGAEILRFKGAPEFIIRAILSHANYTNIQRESMLEHVLFASDEITGLIMAATLVLPSKSIFDLNPSSVKKRMKDKAFARGVNRDDLLNGAKKIEVNMDKHIANVIEFMSTKAEELGLKGK